jgi:hypothetical protein
MTVESRSSLGPHGDRKRSRYIPSNSFLVHFVGQDSMGRQGVSKNETREELGSVGRKNTIGRVGSRVGS